jgi:hypothetical protein
MREQSKLNTDNKMRRFQGQYLRYAAYGFLLLFTGAETIRQHSGAAYDVFGECHASRSTTGTAIQFWQFSVNVFGFLHQTHGVRDVFRQT